MVSTIQNEIDELVGKYGANNLFCLDKVDQLVNLSQNTN